MFKDANNVDPIERAPFQTWSYFIVWSEDPKKLRCISVYYNLTNHFIAMQPSWASNILGARQVWEVMGRPVNPKPATSVGTVTQTRQTMENQKIRGRFKVFQQAMTLRFSMIDVNKNLKISKTKGRDATLKLSNELWLITAPDDTDRLGDCSAAKIPKKVQLIFLQNPSNVHKVDIPEEFECPETARYIKTRSYNELEYRIHPTELRMEYYLWIINKFCNSKMSMFSGYAGGKLTCAALMSDVNVYATGLASESKWWSEICTKAMTLDIADFLDIGYGNPADQGQSSTPASYKKKLRSSQNSPFSLQRNTDSFVFIEAGSEEEEEEEEEEEDEEIPDDGPEGLKDMPTSTSWMCMVPRRAPCGLRWLKHR